MRLAIFTCVLVLCGCGGSRPRNDATGGSEAQNETTLRRNEVPPLSSHKLAPPFIFVCGAVFSPDGKLLFSVSCYDWGGGVPRGFKRLRLWDVETGRELAAFSERGAANLTFLPDGKRVISKPQDGRLEIWEARTGKVLAKFEDSSPEDRLLGLTPDGKLALIGNYDRKEEGLRPVDVETRKPLRVLTRKEYGRTILTPDGKMAYVAFLADKEEFSYGMCKIPSGEFVRYAKRADDPLFPIAISPDGKLALSELEERDHPVDRHLVLWDVATGQEVRRLWGQSARRRPVPPDTYEFMHCAVFSPDGERVTAVNGDETLRCWKVSTGAEVWSLRLDDYLTACAFSPDGKLLATAAGGKQNAYEKIRLRVWDATRGRLLKALDGVGR